MILTTALYTGTITRIFQAKLSANKFYRTFFLKTDEDHPNWLRLQLVGQYCNILDNYKIGDKVIAKVHVTGPEPTGDTLYNNLHVIEMTIAE